MSTKTRLIILIIIGLVLACVARYVAQEDQWRARQAEILATDKPEGS